MSDWHCPRTHPVSFRCVFAPPPKHARLHCTTIVPCNFACTISKSREPIKIALDSAAKFSPEPIAPLTRPQSSVTKYSRSTHVDFACSHYLHQSSCNDFGLLLLEQLLGETRTTYQLFYLPRDRYFYMSKKLLLILLEQQRWPTLTTFAHLRHQSSSNFDCKHPTSYRSTSINGFYLSFSFCVPSLTSCWWNSLSA